MRRKSVSSNSFFYLSILGALYLLVEGILRLFERSLCSTEGCRLVDRLTRFDDLLIILIGFLAFTFLGLLSGINLHRPKGLLDTTINFSLVAALSAEGFFVGYQTFWLPGWCLFCLSVFGIFGALGVLKFWNGSKEMVAGFAAFFLVFGFVGLTFPPQGKALPPAPQRILFYSVDCRYCSEIRGEIEKSRLDITPVLVRDFVPALKNLGIQGVPTLLVNGLNEKLLLTGKEAIHRYLVSCQSGEKETVTESKIPILNKKSDKFTRDVGSSERASPFGGSNPIFNQSAEDGICKENQKCD